MVISIRSMGLAAAVGAAALLGGCAVGPYYDNGYGYGYGNGYTEYGYGDRGGDRREWRDREGWRGDRNNDSREWHGDRDGRARDRDRDRDGRPD